VVFRFGTAMGLSSDILNWEQVYTAIAWLWETVFWGKTEKIPRFPPHIRQTAALPAPHKHKPLKHMHFWNALMLRP
jgi:hypothetical protein